MSCFKKLIEYAYIITHRDKIIDFVNTVIEAITSIIDVETEE